MPFTEPTLTPEKPKVVAQCDFTARSLADVQRLREERLAVSNHVTICVVSGLDAQEVFAQAAEQFGALRLPGRLALATDAHPANLDLTWDLGARHLILVWPIPGFHDPDCPRPDGGRPMPEHAAGRGCRPWASMPK